VLEHFGHNEIIPVLKRWFEVLQPGGILRISVPDIDRIVKIYIKNMPHFERRGNTPWIGLIYGGQSTPYDFHKTGFNANWLGNLLEQAGFINPCEYPNSPHFIPGLIDASLANVPFNEYVSLNMMAEKPVSNIAYEIDARA
jgi:predicted SAM-dependent methyltransferase